jgi:hypothetical protein
MGSRIEVADYDGIIRPVGARGNKMARIWHSLLFRWGDNRDCGAAGERIRSGFGGLFLAFPAIFPASATMVEKHEREKKREAGIFNSYRGRQAAALDARGAAIGSIGLACFAFAVWKLLKL